MGVDLYSHAREQLIAVAAGNVEYRKPWPSGWGNHIYLYFQSHDIRYVAIYAHIDASSAFSGVRSVRQGEPIGTAGCTGNAGNDGQHWRTFTCGGKIAAEDHLHLELLELSTNSLRRIDPVAFFGWTVRFGEDDTCATCAAHYQLIEP